MQGKKKKKVMGYPVGRERHDPQSIAVTYLITNVGMNCYPAQITDRDNFWLVDVGLNHYVMGHDPELRIIRRIPSLFQIKIDKKTWRVFDAPSNEEIDRLIEEKHEPLTECPFCKQDVEETEIEDRRTVRRPTPKDALARSREAILRSFDVFLGDVDDPDFLNDLSIFVDIFHEAYRMGEPPDIEEAKRLFAALMERIEH